MTFDLCFATYNSDKWLPGCLRALAAMQYDKKQVGLYFADNASTDETRDTLALLQKQYAGVFGAFAVLPQAKNLGFGTASNAAARAGHGDCVLFYNVDTEIFPDALSRLAACIAASGPEWGAFEMRQFPYEHPKYYDPVTMETSWASGACLCVRRKVFVKTGGFDESIFMYAEDVDLSWHIRALGYRIRYVPQAVTMHYAYANPHQEKVHQFAGSLTGNLVLRYKYGTAADIRAWKRLYSQVQPRLKKDPRAEALAVAQLERIRAHRREYRAFYRSAIRGSDFAPQFLELDYEFARSGAFYKNEVPQEQPEFTVVIRTYQRPQVLALTLESLRNQVYPHFQVVVVEDGENPVSEEVVRRAEGWLNIRYIAAHAQWGRCRAGNEGIRAAQTEYVCFLDDDDYFFADHFEVMASLIGHNPECKLFCAGAVEGRCLSLNDAQTEFRYTQKTNRTNEKLRMVDFFATNPIPIQAAVFHKSLFERYGGLDEKLDALEDWDLWMRYVSHCRVASVDKATSLYKVPAQMEDVEKRDAFISAYRIRVYEKMAQYGGTISAQDVFSLFWQPKEEQKRQSARLEREELYETAQEIYRSNSWHLSAPLRLLPRALSVAVHAVLWVLRQGVLGALVYLLQLLQKGLDGVDFGLRTAADWVGPHRPDFAKKDAIEMRSFIILAQRSLSMQFARWMQRRLGRTAPPPETEQEAQTEENH